MFLVWVQLIALKVIIPCAITTATILSLLSFDVCLLQTAEENQVLNNFLCVLEVF